VLVPSGSVGVLLGVRGRGESLEDGDISLRGALAIGNVSTLFTLTLGRNIRCVKKKTTQRCTSACCFVNRRVLSPPPKHGPICLIIEV
jgi:hypothetical protein